MQNQTCQNTNCSAQNRGCQNHGNQNRPGMSCPQPRGSAAMPQMRHCGEMNNASRAAVCSEKINSQPKSSGLSKQQLMKRVMLCGFACTDAVLYLDTHPSDTEALSYFQEHNRIYQEAVEEYSRSYGPLTLSHARHCGDYWNWVNQPWPWQ